MRKRCARCRGTLREAGRFCPHCGEVVAPEFPGGVVALMAVSFAGAIWVLAGVLAGWF